MVDFLENFFKKKILLNIKKGSSKFPLELISKKNFFRNFFPKQLDIAYQLVGVLYYAFLLKDVFIFANFFRKMVKKNHLKKHKKVFLGLKNIIRVVFKPIFLKIRLLGFYLLIKGKIGVSGSVKKKKYYIYSGKHTFSSRVIKMDYKFITVWTPTGVLGVNCYLFF